MLLWMDWGLEGVYGMVTCKNPKCPKPDAGTYHAKGRLVPTELKNEYTQVWMCLYCMASFTVKFEVKEDEE